MRATASGNVASSPCRGRFVFSSGLGVGVVGRSHRHQSVPVAAVQERGGGVDASEQLGEEKGQKRRGGGGSRGGDEGTVEERFGTFGCLAFQTPFDVGTFWPYFIHSSL